MRPTHDLLLPSLLSSAALGALLWWAVGVTPKTASEEVEVGSEMREYSEVYLQCVFLDGQRLAYEVSAEASVADTTDRFRGVLSLEVIERDPHSALLRAAFTEVTLTQAMTEARDQSDAAAIEGAPFLLRIDERCAFQKLGFSSNWGVPERQLVHTVLRAQEIVLSGDARLQWEASQHDGSGDYTARYQATPSVSEAGAPQVRVVRQKQLQRAHGSGLELGFELAVASARAEATFDPRSGSIERVRGEELAHLTLPGAPTQAISHRFAMTRLDDAFSPVATLAASAADFSDPFTLARPTEAAQPDDALAALSLDEARAHFLAIFSERGAEGVLPAARFLSAWLRLHPEGAEALLADLRRNALPKHTHATLFLAMEMAGSEATRQALDGALRDPKLSEVNRARAASALADHGEPTAESVHSLRQRAQQDDSSMVATVSRLGLGTMARRADGALGEELHAMLAADLRSAPSRGEVVASLDAIANSADARFEPAVIARLDDEAPSVRAHAAEALHKVDGGTAREALLSRLASEQNPQVMAAMLRSLNALDAESPRRSPEELALAARLLETPALDVRGLTITWLGGAATQIEARLTLVAHFPRETEPKLKQLIGRYVSAAELRAAIGG